MRRFVIGSTLALGIVGVALLDFPAAPAVASRLVQSLPEELRGSLPTIAEIEAELHADLSGQPE
jgi:hypothetical protein